jgi:hypothetical protein
MTKLVALTPAKYNKFAIVDDGDFDRVVLRRWTYEVQNGRVRGRIDGHPLPLANFVLGVPTGTEVDHRDRNPLNNTRANLRVATRSQNGANTITRWRAKSGYRGVFKRNNRYQARINVNNKLIYLGSYITAKEAAIARDDAARQYHGEFAVLNFPDGDDVL